VKFPLRSLSTPNTSLIDTIILTVPETEAGPRLDQFLARQAGFSRARLQRWLKAGLVRVNGQARPASYKVRPGDRIEFTPPTPEATRLEAEALPLDIVFEDRDILVINKPPGLVVHPGAGHRGGTLLNALLAHCPALKEIGDVSRPGLVHRLDKDTSGLMVAAKTARAHESLVRQFQAQQVKKTYVALVWGRLKSPTGEISREIGRHPSERQKMSIHARRGKAAATGWRVLREFPGPVTLVELTPKTGRTHQLRVHLASLGHPVVGDATYGGGAARLKAEPKLKALKPLVTRQLLHARSLGFTHPRSGEALAFEAPLPEDFQAVLDKLKNLN
jgi:23S rRNA pseudouridine1911/1915/1917 synthase